MRLRRYLTEEDWTGVFGGKQVKPEHLKSVKDAMIKSMGKDAVEKMLAGMEDAQVEELQKIKDVLEKDCSKFVREMKGTEGLLWRGSIVPNEPKRSFEMDVRKKQSHVDEDPRYGRRPKAFPPPGHEVFNILSERMYGWRFRNGVMTTPDYDHARQFGKPSIFFPIGDYQYLWHPRIKDFNMYDIHIHGKALKEFEKSENHYDETVDTVWRWFRTYQNVHQDAYAGAYSYFKKNPQEADRIIKILKLDKFMAEYRDDRIQLAIDKGVEVSFRCKEYYLVHSFWSDEITNWLHGG